MRQPGFAARRQARAHAVQCAGVALAALLSALAVRPATPAPGARDLEALAAEVRALRPEHSPRRDLPWRRCLLVGVRDARAADRPLLIWAFRGDPVDHRC